MILEENSKPHQKHFRLTKPSFGEFARNEIALLGTNCADIKSLSQTIIRNLASYKIAYVDADHKSATEELTKNKSFLNGSFLTYTDKISFQSIDFSSPLTSFQRRTVFNNSDLVIVNGNHFTAQNQIVVIDPFKSLEKKLDKLTNVKLILLKNDEQKIPEYLQQITGFDSIPVLNLKDEKEIETFLHLFISERKPGINGLVLSGGESSRMKKDKGNLAYHGTSQREHLYHLLHKRCEKTFISCNAMQANLLADQFPLIQDTFLQLGPLGGILSAFQANPTVAWLSIACDLPFLSEDTIQYLIGHRNPSKLATAFLDPSGAFPEPLITIWEPKSYAVMLQFLALGYSCPRKVLINSDIELLTAPEVNEFVNVNNPAEYQEAVGKLNDVRH